MERIDSPDGLFHEGNPAIGEKGTKVTAVWLNAAQEEIVGIGGNTITAAVETTLNELDGVVFVNGAPIHLPTYGTVPARKRFTIKNIGATDVTINAADGKTIDGAASIFIVFGEKITIVKDGANWQTI